MEVNNNPFFFRYFRKYAIISYFALLSVILIFLPNKLPFVWILSGSISVILFFYFLNILSARWAYIPENIFKKKLFITSVIIRLIYIVLIYFYYQQQTGKPFEFDAADSEMYHFQATWIANLFRTGNLERIYGSYFSGYSDSGWPIVLAVIYYLFSESIIIARILTAFFSAWMVILLYRLGKRNFGEFAGRITAVMAMLLPSFIFYSGLHTKETFMVFLIVAFIERSDKIIRTRNFILRDILIVVILGLSLFFFRTVLAVAAWFSLFSALLLSSNRIIGTFKRVISITWFVLAALLVFSGTIKSEITGYVEERDTNISNQMYAISLGETGNKLATYGKQSIFLPMVLFAPFPTMTDTNQLNAQMINGNVFTRNAYSFFVIIALWILFKRKLIRNHVLIIVILFSYLFILSASGFALSERFHMPALPFLILLSGYGINVINKKTSKYYLLYLIVIGVIIIGWNWFKLAGRGFV